MTTKYIIEIYEPNSQNTVLGSLESDTPFMSISTGDIINSPILDTNLPPNMQLKVTSVEHCLYKVSGAARHKILVFTEPN